MSGDLIEEHMRINVTVIVQYCYCYCTVLICYRYWIHHVAKNI